MRLSVRPTRPEDLVAHQDALLYVYGPFPELHKKLPEVWRGLLAMESVWSIVIESPKEQLVHSMAAFVSDRFLEAFVEKDRPFLGARIAQRFLEVGDEPLSLEAMREAQRGDGLNIVNIHSVYLREGRGETAGGELGEKLAQTSFHDMRGYRIKSCWREVFTPLAVDSYRSGGWHLRSRYGSEGDPSPAHPFLMNVSRAETDDSSGARIAQFFVDYPAFLGLKRVHRELLEQALAGLTDDEMANALSLSASAVKKRWRSIYDRVEDRAPDLLPVPDLGRDGRGQERRRHLLNYLREHPEEMRPWED